MDALSSSPGIRVIRNRVRISLSIFSSFGLSDCFALSLNIFSFELKNKRYKNEGGIDRRV